jgi:transcriptional regulator with XRE-family HTH domain
VRYVIVLLQSAGVAFRTLFVRPRLPCPTVGAVARRSRLVALRERRSLSQEEVAEKAGVHLTTYKRWEEGNVTTLRPRHKRELAAALNVPLDPTEHEPGINWYLARDDEPTSPQRPDGRLAEPSPVPVIANEWSEDLAGRLAAAAAGGAGGAGGAQQITPEVAPRLVHEWLVTDPPQLVELRAGPRIGADLVVRIGVRVDQLRHLDDFVAGADLEGAVSREMEATATLVREATYDDGTGRRLLVVLGDLCQLAGWAAADAGRDRLACHRYATGIAAAHAAGDRPLAGQLASTLAYHLTNTGRASDAVLLAQSAVAGSGAASTATTKALFLERLAWAHAKAGDDHQTERILSAVEDSYADRNPEDDPPWTYWLTPDEVDVMAGRCYVELRRPERARPLLERALSSYGEDRPRETALYTSWLAEAHLQAGGVDEAAHLACDVLALTARTASVRPDDRARHLRRLLHPYRGAASVDDFEERYRSVA